MDEYSKIDQQFTNGFNQANEYYKTDELIKCIDLCRDLLKDPTIPRYHKMKTLTLLGATVGDWHEAHDCLLEAEALWKLARRWHLAGRGEVVDDSWLRSVNH